MALHHADKWIWDSWYVKEGPTWHAFFLQADRSLGDPALRHWEAELGHATSADLTHWTYRGTCFEPRKVPAWDDLAIWTGCVTRGSDNQWHMFYTGTSHGEQGRYQRIGHAVSPDLNEWRRVRTGLCLDLVGPESAQYETEPRDGVWPGRAMRDPWVMRDPAGKGWLMIFAARSAGHGPVNEGGAIGIATSPDLYRWTLRKPIFTGSFANLEMPQIVMLDGRWYCLFSTAAADWSDGYAATAPTRPVTGTHYLVGDAPRGPWTVAPGTFLDGAEPPHRYGSRIAETDDGPVLMGFARGQAGKFEGHVTNPAPLRVHGDGRLSIATPELAA